MSIQTLSRRELLKTTACGFGYVALASLAAQLHAEESPLAAKSPHFTPKAKRVIFMFMQGGPSHVDTFDYKPQLAVDDGKADPGPRGRGRKFLKSPFEFKQHGESGLWI